MLTTKTIHPDGGITIDTRSPCEDETRYIFEKAGRLLPYGEIVDSIDDLDESERASAIRGINAGIDSVINNWCNV